MKSKLILLLAAMALVTACKDEFEKIKVHNHDKNEMMKIMHGMMTEMEMMTMTKDPDHDFAMMMKMHHQGAINMAQYEIDNGDDAEMIAIAQKIKDAQLAEIAQLNVFLASHTADTINEEFSMKMMASMDKMNRTKDLQVIIDDADYDFASLMVAHHQSAIEMAQAELDHGKHQEMKDMAMNIIDAQEKEIDELQTWLLNHKEY